MLKRPTCSPKSSISRRGTCGSSNEHLADAERWGVVNLSKQGVKPEEIIPSDIIFSEAEIDRVNEQILAVRISRPVLRRIEFFASQFEFCEVAADQFEYKTKDTARLVGAEWAEVTARDTGRDRLKDLGCQTRNGLSVRALMTLIHLGKAMAFFRGNRTVDLEDLRQVLPFVLHAKLVPDNEAPFFEAPGNEVFKTDRIGWLRRVLDLACAEYDRLGLDRTDPVGELILEMQAGLEGLTEPAVRGRLAAIERQVAELGKGRKLYGHIYDDLIQLKYLHQRYTNYLRWLRTAG